MPDDLRKLIEEGAAERLRLWASCGGVFKGPDGTVLRFPEVSDVAALLAVVDAAEKMDACDPWADPTDDVVATLSGLSAALRALRDPS